MEVHRVSETNETNETNEMQITIDPEFKALIPPLAPEELAQLEANILRDGCRDPLVVWSAPDEFTDPDCLHAATEGGEVYCKYCRNDVTVSIGDGVIACDKCGHGLSMYRHNEILIDGHNRHAICTKHDLPFETVEMEFDGRNEAEIWIIDNQTGRRNLENIDKVPLLERKREIVAKAADDRHRVLSGTRSGPGQAVVNLPPPADKTRDTLAAEIGVSGKTYDALRTVSTEGTEELKQAVRDKRVGASTAAEIAHLPPETQREIATLPTRREIVEEVKKHVHVAQNSGENEWYTPPQFIESARRVMGSIDTDPASSEIANQTVKAIRFFTKDDDGLKQKWIGNVWMNPPYAQPLIGSFAEAISSKFASSEIKQAVVLVNNATETQWFQRMAGVASAVCFPKTRVRFLDPQGNPGAPLQGQAIIYFGESADAFTEEFSKYGATFS
jgi:ParB family chromosome partitioning protein